MKKSLILVAAPPACGKNYVSELICKTLDGVCYLDKDDLGGLVRAAFAAADEPLNMDGEFYLRNLRDEEYATLNRLALSALRFSGRVLMNAPFLREVRDEAYMRALKEKANALGASVVLVWVTASPEVCHARMAARASDRDEGKLAAWETYVRGVNYEPPHALTETGAVDRLFVFDNENDEAAKAALREFVKLMGE